jgi:hypothetical protein
MNVMTNPTTVATLAAIADRAANLGGLTGGVLAATARAAIKAPTEGERLKLQRQMLENVHVTRDADLVAMVRSIQDDVIASGWFKLPVEVRAAF